MNNSIPQITPPQSQHRHAFTLIELLVVVTIILVLLALMMPSVNSAIENANFGVCQSNVRQLSISSYGYMTDFNNSIPDAFGWLSTGANLHGWHLPGSVKNGLLGSYVPNGDVYLCSVFTRTYALKLDGQSSWQCGETVASMPAPVFSYTMNSYLGWTGWNGKAGIIQKYTAVKKPSQCLFFGEEDGWIQGGVYASWSINNASMGWGNPCDCVATYHFPPDGNYNLGCSNAVFIDGHTEKVWNYNNTNMLYNALW